MTTTKTPTEIAEEAYEATKDFPCFEPRDRFEALLQYLVNKNEDHQAAVIKACRVKAGLA